MPDWLRRSPRPLRIPVKASNDRPLGKRRFKAPRLEQRGAFLTAILTGEKKYRPRRQPIKRDAVPVFYT
jgi:hypothetical protein